ncbi:hypothetical protein [Nonlabens sp.]|uniref:hypothetical protein n=1 Tax=Nonlabens sp. TaxID=1888209 RepID=UPI0025DE7C5D|nr:hypothetical protein [Nonlabens sp.]
MNKGEYMSLDNFGKTSDVVDTKLTMDHPIDLARYQVVHCYMGRAGWINAAGISVEDDFQQLLVLP